MNPTAKHLLSVRAAGDLSSEARKAEGETEGGRLGLCARGTGHRDDCVDILEEKWTEGDWIIIYMCTLSYLWFPWALTWITLTMLYPLVGECVVVIRIL